MTPNSRKRPCRAGAVASVLLSLLWLGGCARPMIITRVEALDAVPGVVVDVSSSLGRFIHFDIRNDGDRSWTVVWDESCYVDPEGRAVRMLVLPLDAGARSVAQPSSPLPAGASIRERCALRNATLRTGTDGAAGVGKVVLVLARGEERREWTGALHLEKSVRFSKQGE